MKSHFNEIKEGVFGSVNEEVEIDALTSYLK